MNNRKIPDLQQVDSDLIKFDDLILQNGIYHKKYTKYFFVKFLIPFTGRVTGIAEGELIHGIPQGYFEQYYEYVGKGSSNRQGVIKTSSDWEIREKGPIVSKGVYRNGKKEGSWVYFFYHNQISDKGIYKNGKKEGLWISYHESGEVYGKLKYKEGKLDGRYVLYHKNGQLELDGEYKNGR